MGVPGSNESRLKGLIAYQGYRWLARFAEILPQSAIPGVAKICASIGVRTLSVRRKLVASHLQRVRNEPPSHNSVKRAFAFYIAYWLEALRLPSVPTETLMRNVEIEGVEHLTEARTRGNGVILALAHMGNWDTAGRWLVESGTPLTVVAERLRPEKLHTWFRDFRKSLGFEVLENGPRVVNQVNEALRANRAVALLCDRDVDGTGRPVQFFGEETPLPGGPAVIALRTGAVLLPVGIYKDGRKSRVVIHEPLQTDRQSSFRDDVQRIHQDLVKSLEKIVSVDPEQWHLFGANWPSDRDLLS